MHVRRALLPCAAALAAAAVGAGVAAAAYSDVSRAGGAAAGGTLVLGGDLPAATTWLTATDLRQGELRTGTPLRTTGAGSAHGLLRIVAAGTPGDALAERLTVVVDRCADSACASVAASASAPATAGTRLAMGRLDAGATTWLRLGVRWSGEAGAAGRSTEVPVTVSLVSPAAP